MGLKKRPQVRAPSDKKTGRVRRELFYLMRQVAVLAGAGWILFTQIFMFVRVQGTEMFPALKDGDLALVFRMQRSYAAGDVVSYEADGALHIGRIIAGENDVVTFDGSGGLLVNGTVQSGDILYPTYARSEDEDQADASEDEASLTVRIPQTCVYILGDYRTQSMDSRDFGPIPSGQVKGKVITILRRRGI